MSNSKFDICIVGSGAGGSPIAFELSNAGYSVVVIEKGPFIKTEQFTKDEMVASRKDVYASRTANEPQVIEWKDENGNFVGKSNRHKGISFWNGNCVGGSSNFMSGFFHRAKPNDFRLLTTYGAIEGANIVDWPITYDELEPYYDKVEKIIGVSGQVKPHKFLEPRSSNQFPYPPLKTNFVAELIDKAANELNIETIQIPRAILSTNNNGRNACYYSNYCGSYGCNSNAKGSSRAALLDKLIENENFKIITNAKVFHLETNGNGKIIKAHYHLKNQEDQNIEADIFIVAAQAIETSRLLLMSKNPEFPNGLANNSGQVGKNLIFSGGGIGSGVFYKEDFDHKTFDELMKPGLFVNRAIQQWYEIDAVDFGVKSKGGTIDFLWEHANAIRKAINLKRNNEGNLLIGSELKTKLHQYFTERKKITFEIFTDWLPNDNCFVSLDEKEKDIWGDDVARIRINNHIQDEKVGNYLAVKATQVLQKMGVHEIKTKINGAPPTNLQAGGCRFGNDPKLSVLDVNCKAHEVENLYVTDGSFMPTGGSSTFTWTIYANSFRVADIIINSLNKKL